MQWEFGDGTIEKNKLLSMAHSFSQRGPKVVVQTIVLKDGTTLTNFITLFVVDPSLLASYSLQTHPNKLNPNTLQIIKYSSRLQGDTLNEYITFLQNYDSLRTETSEETVFPFTADFIYNQ
ncbi:hypothetical protein KKG31_01670 [Patescibacteria group bacterium]|nr:hypothetical protein [Patescibacteria group bacterium]MBU1757882.1 hypothetical protein [Patescibacteria group bacterium]